MKYFNLVLLCLNFVFIIGCDSGKIVTTQIDNKQEIEITSQTPIINTTSNNLTTTSIITEESITMIPTTDDISTLLTSAVIDEVQFSLISEVKLLSENDYIMTRGIVTKILTDKLMFIEDESGSISVYGDLLNIREGDSISLNGYKTFHNGLHQVIPHEIIIISSNNNITEASLFDSDVTNQELIETQGERFDGNSLILHSIEQDTYGNLTFILEDINSNKLFNGRYDSRLSNVIEMTEHLLSLEDQIVLIEDVILSIDEVPVFMFTKLSEIYLMD